MPTLLWTGPSVTPVVKYYGFLVWNVWKKSSQIENCPEAQIRPVRDLRAIDVEQLIRSLDFLVQGEA